MDLMGKSFEDDYKKEFGEKFEDHPDAKNLKLISEGKLIPDLLLVDYEQKGWIQRDRIGVVRLTKIGFLYYKSLLDIYGMNPGGEY